MISEFKLHPPVLATTRLILRPHNINDLQSCAEMWSDPSVIQFIGGGKPSTPTQTWSRILNYSGHWRLMGFGYWAVEEKSTSCYIGEVGFADFKRDIPSVPANIPELGWVLATSAHGKGYGTEAVLAATKWGDEHFAANESFCLIDPRNTSSIRLAGKVGYSQTQLLTYNSQPTLSFTRKRVQGE